MSRPLAIAAWLATLLAVVGTSAAALAVADLGTAVTVGVGVLALVVGLLAAGAVLVALRPRLLEACSGETPAGCGACGKSCLRAGASTG